MFELNTEIIMVEKHLTALKKVARICKGLDLILNFDGNEKSFSITTGSCGTIATDTETGTILYEEDY